MKNLNIKFIDEQDNDVTFDVLANESQVKIAEIQIPNLSVSKIAMNTYVKTVLTLLSHPRYAAIEDLLLWLIDSWNEQSKHGVVHRYLYDHIMDCYCGVLED